MDADVVVGERRVHHARYLRHVTLQAVKAGVHRAGDPAREVRARGSRPGLALRGAGFDGVAREALRLVEARRFVEVAVSGVTGQAVEGLRVPLVALAPGQGNAWNRIVVAGLSTSTGRPWGP